MVLPADRRDDRSDGHAMNVADRTHRRKEAPMSRRERNLYRDSDDQKLGGVCSGLARYFDLDPLLVRVAFVAGLVFSGVSLVAYILLWWLVDPAPDGYWTEASDGPLPAPTVADDQPHQQREDWVA
jgi:phage shock protein C